MKTMRTMKQQQGMTLIGWMLVIIFFAIVVMFVLKVAPIYLENMSVRSTLNSLKEEADGFSRTNDVRVAISRRFSINDVKNVTTDDVIVTQENGMFQVNVNYEVRTSFLYNIDLVLAFDNSTEVPVR